MRIEIIKRIMKYIGKHSPLILLSTLLTVVTVGTTLYAPILVGRGIDTILGPRTVDFAQLKSILIHLGIIIGITSATQWLVTYINNYIAYRVVREIRGKAFHQLEHLSVKYLDSHAHGDLLSRIVSDIDQFSDGLLLGFAQLTSGILSIVGTLYFMWVLNPTLAIVVVIVTPLSLFVASFIAKKTYHMFAEQSKERGELTSFIHEMIGNQKLVQSFAYENRAQNRFEAINNRLAKASQQAIFFSSITNPATRFVNSIVYAAVGILGALFVIRGTLTVGQLTSFLNYANQYTKPFNEISGVITELQNAIACAGRVFELLDTPIMEREDGKNTLSKVDGSIVLDGVSFSYEKEKPFIQDLNLCIKPGQKVAIVGPTGCGKTTLINLLMGFYEIDKGRILISSQDMKDVTKESIRDNYGMVLQETWLQSGTIRENIAYGNSEATIEQVIDAAKKAHAHSFIKRLPHGYDTKITENGGDLSQGQKQLLCITRVMLNNPPMFILDEATSSIDTRTEVKIQNAFSKMMENRTGFIVAHRLSTIKDADVILVMKDGKVMEIGKHEELLAKNGFYTQLHNSQFQTA